MKTLTAFIAAGLLICCAAQAEEIVIDLAWQDSGISQNFRADNYVSTAFAKEPQTTDDRIFRGNVWLDDLEPTGFVWVKSEGKVYIDLNRDGDLTNDPNGILNEKTEENRPDYDHEFEPFTITRPSPYGTLSYVIGVHITHYPPSYFYPIFSLRSGYTGQIQQNQTKWDFSVADMPGRTEDRRFLCCLAQPGIRWSPTWWSLPEQIFFGGKNYSLRLQWTQRNDSPLLQAVLTETQPPMGLLETPGTNLQSLLLKGATSIVFPEISDRPVPVPAGPYDCLELLLKGKEEYRSVRPTSVNNLFCSVPENGTGEFKAGGPLNQTVSVVRVGNTLRFSYELLGIGGEKYDVRQATGYDSRTTPKVNIYKGDLLLASGEFEFG